MPIKRPRRKKTLAVAEPSRGGTEGLWRSPRSKTKKAPEFDWKCIEWDGKGGKRGHQEHRADVHFHFSNVFKAVNEDYDAAVKFFEAGRLNDGTSW